MLANALYVALTAAVALELAANAYVVFAAWCVTGFRKRREHGEGERPPVTVLMPICGVDAGLLENLRAICSQDYPEYQVLLGVQDPGDPAIDVVRQIIRSYPDRDISLVIADRASGPNLKIGNLSNMYLQATHRVLVILDSDMRVEPTYLASVVPPLADPGVGVVTCLYKGTPAKGLPSLLGSMFVNEWFFASVLVALRFGQPTFCFGATMAIRRDVLEAIGGFARLKSYLADDYMLGQLVRAHGYRIHVSSYIVENILVEHSFKSLFLHELRWAKTIRTVQPLGYAFSFVTYSIPLAIVAAVLIELTADTEGFEWGILALAVLLRMGLHYVSRSALEVSYGLRPLLVPVRDMISFVVWASGLFGRGVVWRGERLQVGRTGKLIARSEAIR